MARRRAWLRPEAELRQQKRTDDIGDEVFITRGSGTLSLPPRAVVDVQLMPQPPMLPRCMALFESHDHWRRVHRKLLIHRLVLTRA